MRSLRVLGLTVLTTLAAASAARADFHGQGPVKKSHVVETYHVDFTLPEDGWLQVHGLLEGTPALGQYQLPSPQGGLRLSIYVHAVLQKSRPVRQGRYLLIKPGTNDKKVRIDRHGKNGPVRWWTGTAAGGSATRPPDNARASAVGYQRAPRRLDPSGKRWLVYAVYTDLSPTAATVKDPFTVAAVHSVASTMRLGAGPVETPEPTEAVDY